MEKAGFKVDQLQSTPVTMITLLTRGAFKAKHPELSDEKIDAIYESLENKNVLLEKLAEMYAEHAQKLVDGGNVKWEANW